MRVVVPFLIGLLIFPLAASSADIIPEDKAVIRFETKTGTVTFLHTLHASLRVTQCDSCHHTHEPGQAIKPCADCHKKNNVNLNSVQTHRGGCFVCHH